MPYNSAAHTDARDTVALCYGQAARAGGCGR